MIVAGAVLDTVVAVGILGWFVGFGFFAWADLKRLSERLLADEVGVDSAPTTIGADSFPREWPVATSGPIDHEADVA